jgi:pyridoxal phosphate-dependent aminotransferase EpsN
MKRILLSVPHMSGYEQAFVAEAFHSNWLSTVGPNVSAFELLFEKRLGVPALALASGTAAIHLGLRALGVGPGDEVMCSDLTFVASVNPIRYLGAEPVLIDSNYETWNMDPQRLSDALRRKASVGRLPRAVVAVHLFGQCCDMDPLREICSAYGVPVLEDAAEALGSQYKGRPAGTLSDIAMFSFNGNKIITTAGGGMLVSTDRARLDKVLYWSTQARHPGIGYEHSEIGFNYRMSNVLAGIGCGQLRVLDDRIEQRRAIAFRYRDAFADLPGISLMPQAPYGVHTNWLSCFLIDAGAFGCERDELIRRLDAANIETRPVWRPMHLQALYARAETFGGAVGEDLFRRGICLPSSSNLSLSEQSYVIDQVRAMAGAPAGSPASPLKVAALA